MALPVRRSPFAPLVGCLLLTLAACDDGDDPVVDAALMVDAVSSDALLPDPDAGEPDPDAGPPADMDPPEPDAAPCLEPPECEDRERLVACECHPVADRRCVTDADCRPGETCRSEDDWPVSVCWFEAPAMRVCPGPACEGGEGDGVVYAAGVSRIITPVGFETPTPEGLDGSQINFATTPDLGFEPGVWNDCGLDGLCPGDEGYDGPDEGEADGRMQGIWIAGFSAGRPAQYCPPERIGCDGPECCVSKFAHDHLKSQIAVVRQNDVTVAFAAVDTVGFFHSDIERIRARVEPLGVDLLIMGASHSHEGPDTAGQWGPGDGLPVVTGRDAAFLALIEEQTVDGIREAIENLEPADVKAGVIDTGVDGLAISDSRTPYIFNDDLPVVHLTAQDDGASLATLISYGNHAEVLWSGNPYLTSDYFHFTRKYIREGLAAVETVDGEQKPALPGTGGVVVMFAGSVGGLINPGRGGGKDYAGFEPPDEHSFEAADAVGQTLASHVLAGLQDGRVADTQPDGLSFAAQQFLVPVQNMIFRLASITLDLIHRDVYNVALLGGRQVPGDPFVLSEVSIVRFGPVRWFTAPGEIFPETLVGGFPGRDRVRTPVIGDIARHRVDYICDADGLPVEGGDQPCIIRPDATNPPDWDAAPEGPFVYEQVGGEVPFFIGLGMDFMGYIVPDYDYDAPPFGEAEGDHYEETNSVGAEVMGLWRTHLEQVIDGLP